MMDYNKILLHLTIDITENEEIKDFDVRLQRILQKMQPMLTENDKMFITDSNEDENGSLDVRYEYICTLVCVLKNIKQSNSTDDESVFNIKQCQILKVSVELITAMGIIPGLLPGVGVDMAKLCPRALEIYNEKLTDMQKYKRLRFAVNSIVQLYDEMIFRPAIVDQIGPLFAALLQLCYAPLMKPLPENVAIKEENKKGDNFKMTTELYDKLRKDQKYFECILLQLLTNCPVPIIMKELMVILGVKRAPKWLQRQTRKCLINQLMQPNGVVSIIAAVCDNALDLGEHWNQLDTISKLIATPHGNNTDEYFKSICPQLLNLLTSTEVKHSTTIANCCIAALYEYNPSICLANIVEVICTPLLLNSGTVQKARISENDVDKCIQNLSKCFITEEAKFKQLPCKLLMNVATPLFSLYNNIRKSACALKSNIKYLLLLLLHEEPSCSLFAAFLGHKLSNDLGNRLISEFGPTSGIEITGVDTTCTYEKYANSLFDLTSTSRLLSTALFSYLLTFLSNSTQLENDKGTKMLLDTEDDVMEKLEKQLAAVNLLSNLANVSAVQEAQIENPTSILSFVKSLFEQYIKKKQTLPEEDDCELLFISLMLIKMILSERKKPVDWAAFSGFVKILKKCRTLSNVPSQLALLSRELIELIESQGRSEQKHYQDLSVDCKPSNKFEEALKDLADPLLPVRAHGLIVLTKLIESGDACTIARKAVLLQLFKENLKHEDSFIYLAAINGLCALTTSYPQIVIETLMQEYIAMPQRVLSEDLTVEVRIKLGEVLVKVTRALGEMVIPYKNTLISGFLCATTDPVDLVRASSLSCLGEICKILGFRLGDAITEVCSSNLQNKVKMCYNQLSAREKYVTVLYCISCIIKTDKSLDSRRAAVMVTTLLIRGLEKHMLTNMTEDLVNLYRAVKYLHDNDTDPGIRLHASLTLQEIDSIVRDTFLPRTKLEKNIFLLGSP